MKVTPPEGHIKEVWKNFNPGFPTKTFGNDRIEDRGTIPIKSE